MEKVAEDSIPVLMPSMPADREDFNEYSKPTLVVSERDLANFKPVVTATFIGMALVPYLSDRNSELINTYTLVYICTKYYYNYYKINENSKSSQCIGS